MRVLFSGAATDNPLSVLEVAAPAGHTPPHRVHEDEEQIVFVLPGEMTFFVGDRRHYVVPDS
ncbi:cupin domain-containing protein [Streptomyces sp. NPDC005892]|uniref:cupin domain-containing protein n=1 Tax=Streptomyces sp. NPDC005892 TaxID=3155593 RepID=UPI0033DC8C1B